MAANRDVRRSKFKNDARLFLGGLPEDVTPVDVRELLKKYGELDDINVVRDKRIAFVRFDYRHNAEKAKSELHDTVYKSQRLMVRWATSRGSLWVGDLNPAVTDEILADAFRAFGELEDCYVVAEVTNTGSQSSGHGFVHFKKKADCERAREAVVQNALLLTTSPRPIRAEFAQLRADGFAQTDQRPSAEAAREHATPPRFAQPDTLEFQFASELKMLAHNYAVRKQQLREQHNHEVATLREQHIQRQAQYEEEMRQRRVLEEARRQEEMRRQQEEEEARRRYELEQARIQFEKEQQERLMREQAQRAQLEQMRRMQEEQQRARTEEERRRVATQQAEMRLHEQRMALQRQHDELSHVQQRQEQLARMMQQRDMTEQQRNWMLAQSMAASAAMPHGGHPGVNNYGGGQRDLRDGWGGAGDVGRGQFPGQQAAPLARLDGPRGFEDAHLGQKRRPDGPPGFGPPGPDDHRDRRPRYR